MLSSDEEFKIFENDDKDQLELLTNFINDPSCSKMQRKKYRQQRILINYKRKKYQEVLHDVEILEQIDNVSGLFLILKLKSAIHEQCRTARLCLMERINDGDNTEDCETLFLNIRQEKVDQFMNGLSTTISHSATKKNKRKKVSD